jgi:hypothetical protein
MLTDASTKWTAAGCSISATSSTCPTSTLPTNYGNKNVLVLASDAFNDINNSQANIAP